MLEDLRLYKEKKFQTTQNAGIYLPIQKPVLHLKALRACLPQASRDAKLSHTILAQNLNLSMMKGCVHEKKGGNRVFAVLIETSVANPRRNAGRQNVAQCWLDSSKRMKMWLKNRLSGPKIGLDDEKAWMQQTEQMKSLASASWIRFVLENSAGFYLADAHLFPKWGHHYTCVRFDPTASLQNKQNKGLPECWVKLVEFLSGISQLTPWNEIAA